MKGQDILGNIAILKFERKTTQKEKKKEALAFLKKNKSVRTVLEKTNKFSGRLRTLKTKFLAGEKNLEALYNENGCAFRFNVESCYFSSRLAAERAKIAGMVKKGEDVLVMFGGVAPFAIVIAKHSKAGRVVSVELGKECSKYALVNAKRNKLSNVEIIQGDVRRRLPKMRERFDRIVMARPNLEDNFLDVAFPRVKKNGIIHYYGFYLEDDVGRMREMILNEAEKAKKKIKILKIERAGDIGTYKFRYRADLKVLN
ncbi:MAG: class I SAM-dependent methyltransferase family protein [archaeon]|nr:class I SAM-dependent methyltransferase family protein [archaeon]